MHLVLGKPIRVWARMPIPIEHRHVAPPFGQSINDLVVDDRTKNNHKKFTKGLGNFTGTAMTVDNLDEAMEASVHFTGLRRPQSVKQRNPLQLTEHDEGTYKKNPKFKFNHTD